MTTNAQAYLPRVMVITLCFICLFIHSIHTCICLCISPILAIAGITYKGANISQILACRRMCEQMATRDDNEKYSVY